MRICLQLHDWRTWKHANHTFASDTIVPNSTFTTFPSGRKLFPTTYNAEVEGPAPISGLPTDLNGPYYGGAYDVTFVENATETVSKENSTTS